jgi:hypothetical protein
MSESERPIPESYWVIPGRFLAGEYPGHPHPEQNRRRMETLVQAGFQVFIDLTEAGECEPYLPSLSEAAGVYGREVTYRRFPIGDFGLPAPGVMDLILEAIDQALAGGRKVYLHCWGGIGRTGTTVGCYLVRHGLNGRQALDQLAAWWRSVPKSRLHPRSPETQRQEAFVLDWDQSAGSS